MPRIIGRVIRNKPDPTGPAVSRAVGSLAVNGFIPTRRVEPIADGQFGTYRRVITGKRNS